MGCLGTILYKYEYTFVFIYLFFKKLSLVMSFHIEKKIKNRNLGFDVEIYI